MYWRDSRGIKYTALPEIYGLGTEYDKTECYILTNVACIVIFVKNSLLIIRIPELEANLIVSCIIALFLNMDTVCLSEQLCKVTYMRASDELRAICCI